MTDIQSEATQAAHSSRSVVTGSFIWYELMTPDAGAAKDFYEAVVGWQIGEPQTQFAGYRMIGRSDGGFAGGILPITAEMRQESARPGWLAYLGVDDVDDTVKRINELGGRTWMRALDIANVGRVALVSDPQAAPFYVMTPQPPAGASGAKSDVFSPDAPQRVGWNELQTDDVEAARRFYGDLFGWNTEEFMDMGEMGKYRFIEHDGQRLGALFNATGGQSPHFRFYIRVHSVANAKTIAQTRGAIIHMGPHQVPTGDWIIVGTDPQGAEFALVGGA